MFPITFICKYSRNLLTQMQQVFQTFFTVNLVLTFSKFNYLNNSLTWIYTKVWLYYCIKTLIYLFSGTSYCRPIYIMPTCHKVHSWHKERQPRLWTAKMNCNWHLYTQQTVQQWYYLYRKFDILVWLYVLDPVKQIFTQLKIQN